MTNSMNASSNNFKWQGRDDLEDGAKGTRVHHAINTSALGTAYQEDAPQPKQNCVSLIGFCSDAGVARNKGRIGAAKGPDIIRQMLANMAWHSTTLIRDKGNVECIDDDLEHAQHLLSEHVAKSLNNSCVIVLGGGHEVAYGSFSGLAKHLQNRPLPSQSKVNPPKIGIINFDAHFDLRSYQTKDKQLQSSIKPSSGTPFKQIADQCDELNWPFHYACLGVSRTSNTQALFDSADELGVWYVTDDQLTAHNLAAHQIKLSEFIDQCDVIYLTIDLDVFPAANAPGVSAPAGRGVSLDNFFPLFEQVLSHGNKLKLADIAEYNPNYDIDGHTARLAARLCWEIAERSAKSEVRKTK